MKMNTEFLRLARVSQETALRAGDDATNRRRRDHAANGVVLARLCRLITVASFPLGLSVPANRADILTGLIAQVPPVAAAVGTSAYAAAAYLAAMAHKNETAGCHLAPHTPLPEEGGFTPPSQG